MKRTFLLACACGAALACSERPAPESAAAAGPDPEDYRARIAADPSDADAWFHLADQLERGGDYEEEADALRKVVALSPDLGWAHVKLGTTYNRLGRWGDAVRTFEGAPAQARTQPVLFNNLAVAYGKLGRPADQIAALRKAIAIRPRYASARYNLGIALLARGDRRGAREQVRALEAFDEGAADSLGKALDAGRGGKP